MKISELNEDVGDLKGLGLDVRLPGGVTSLADRAAKQAATVGSKALQTVNQQQPGDVLSVSPKVNPNVVLDHGTNGDQPTYDVASGQNSGLSFFDNLMNAVKANPMLFAAGAVALLGALIVVPRLLKRMGHGGTRALPAGDVTPTSSGEPVQVMGLGSFGKKRRAKRKGGKFYVHYGSAGSSMSTVSFKSKAAAQKAVREAKAAGESARLQKA